MSDSIFREMFVELGDAVMAALQAAATHPTAPDAKGAVAAAYSQPSRSSLLLERRALWPIRDRYHWRSLTAVRSASVAGIDFTVVRDCGHRQRFRLFEDELDQKGAITLGTMRWSWWRWSWVLPPRLPHEDRT